MSWNKIFKKCSICTKSLFCSHFVHSFVYIPVSEHFSFAKIIQPPDRCSISRSWLNGMIITKVHLVLGTIKGHSKMCSFVTPHNAADVSSFEGVCNWYADCRIVHQSFCQIIECSFLEIVAYWVLSFSSVYTVWQYFRLTIIPLHDFWYRMPFIFLHDLSQSRKCITYASNLTGFAFPFDQDGCHFCHILELWGFDIAPLVI